MANFSMDAKLTWLSRTFSNSKPFNWYYVSLFLFTRTVEGQLLGFENGGFIPNLVVISIETLTVVLVFGLRHFRSVIFDRKIGPWENFLWILGAGVAVSMVSTVVQIQFFGESFGNASASVFWLGVYMLFLFITMSRISLVTDEYLEAKLFIDDLKQKIENIQFQTSSRLEAEQQQMQDETKQALNELFGQLEDSQSARDQVLFVQEVVTDFQNSTIRPISKALTDEFVQIEQAASRMSVRNPFSLPEKYNFSQGISPLIVGVLSILFVGGQYSIYGPDAFEAATITAVVEVIVLVVLRKLFKGWIVDSKIGLLMSALLSLLTTFIGTATSQFLQLAADPYQMPFWQHFGSNLQLAPILYFGIAYSSLIRENLRIMNQTQTDLQRKFSREENVLLQRMWIMRKRWGMFLHGTVQSALNAAVIRLQSGKRTDLDWENFIRDIQQAQQMLTTYSEEQITVDEAIHSINKLWRDVVSIEYLIAPETIEKINSDASACFAINEIWRECISNAVRHGGANKVFIRANLIDDCVEMTVANNGEVPNSTSQRSLGASILDDLTLEWWIDSHLDQLFSVSIHARLHISEKF